MKDQSSFQLKLLQPTQEGKKRKWLSHSAIELGNRCPRCFWLTYREKIRQPEGIQSRLANRFDIVLKRYFDGYRGKKELPPLIKDKLKGQLQNPFQEKYFHQINDKYGFYGKLDECLVVENKYVPVDFKTTSSNPKDQEILEAYRNQIDEYSYLIAEDNKPIAGYGYLIFFYPDLSEKVHNGFPMIIKIEKVEAHLDKVLPRIEKAINVLESPMPKASPECPFCNWFEKVKSYYK